MKFRAHKNVLRCRQCTRNHLFPYFMVEGARSELVVDRHPLCPNCHSNNCVYVLWGEIDLESREKLLETEWYKYRIEFISDIQHLNIKELEIIYNEIVDQMNRIHQRELSTS